MTDTHSHETSAPGNGVQRAVRVWDPFVRTFHWALVVVFAVAWLSADESQPIHEIAGYMVAGLVALRLIWGVVGSRYARFAQFLCGPAATIAYLGDMRRGKERRYLGHNPAGAAMIAALLVTLSGTALTGWLIQEPGRVAMLSDLSQVVMPAFAAGDGDEGDAGKRDKKAVKTLHEGFANLLLVLVALHVAGVAIASLRHNENLARAMVTGEKRAPGPRDIA